MSYPNFMKSCRHTQSKLIVTVGLLVINSHQSFRHVNMTTLLSRTASCHNASLLQYSPGNDLQLDPASSDRLSRGPRHGRSGYYTAGAALDSLPSLVCMCCVDNNYMSLTWAFTTDTAHKVVSLQTSLSPINC